MPSRVEHAAIHAADAVSDRPAWLAVGVGLLSGFIALGATVVAGGFLLGEASAGWEPHVTLGDTNLHRWVTIAVLCFLPMLVTALVTLAISANQSPDRRAAARQRLRQVTWALVLFGVIVSFSGLDADDGEFLGFDLWRSTTLLRGVLSLYATVAAAAFLAWGSAWLALAIATWQPPAHLVRRPLPQR